MISACNRCGGELFEHKNAIIKIHQCYHCGFNSYDNGEEYGFETESYRIEVFENYSLITLLSDDIDIFVEHRVNFRIPPTANDDYIKKLLLII